MPARHEWVKQREMMPEDKYDLYFDNGDVVTIPADDYEYGSKGKSYYVVTCGDKGIGVFDAKKYGYSPES